MRELTEGVYVEDRYSTYGDYHGCNYGYVETGDGIVAIDTPEWPSDAVAYRDELADRGEVAYLINTHEHIDHVAGNFYVPGRRVSHQLVREAIVGQPDIDRTKNLLTHLFPGDVAREKVSAVDEWDAEAFDWEDIMRLIFEDMDPDSLEYLDGYDMMAPEVAFRDEAALHVGECTFRLLHVPGHVESHIAVYVPEKGVLFSGDNVTTECYPSMAGSHPYDWLDSLDRLASLQVDHVVPGHGPTADDSSISAFHSFLESAMDRVDRVTEDLTVDQAVNEVSFDDLRPALHPMPLAHRDDVERLYEVLS